MIKKKKKGLEFIFFFFLFKKKCKNILYLLEEGLELSANEIYLHSNINIKLSTCSNDTKMSMENFIFEH